MEYQENNLPAIEIRRGSIEDTGFLREMLYEAVYWRPGGERPPLEAGLADPGLAKILEDWGRRAGDREVIAVGQDGQPVGAAWYHPWRREDHFHGFSDEQIPEIGIGVVGDARRQGVGSALLKALITQARREGLQALSLSVDLENPARRLYEKFGFEPQRAEGGSLLMVLDLGCGKALSSA
jgi:GNAT superfamily N-acetyltransferase